MRQVFYVLNELWVYALNRNIFGFYVRRHLILFIGVCVSCQIVVLVRVDFVE